MSINIRFMVYNAYGIGGTVKTVFNFADYFQKTGKYNVEIISIKRTKETTTLPLNPNIKLTALQDARRSAQYSEEDRKLLVMPSELIHPEEDLYRMFNAYTDKKLHHILSQFHDGVLVTTMPSFNVLATMLVDDKVLKVGQEHKSYADHTPGIQELIRKNYGKLDALTILTERNRHVYERKICGNVPVYVLGNGTEMMPYRASLKKHVIIAAGRYADQKGYDILLQAFGLIAKQFSDWILKIYGEGELTTEYLKIIHDYNLENQVILEPGTDQMNEKMSEASVLLCSSRAEPFGMSIIEGFAIGLPCVSFACDGPIEIITDGYDGIIVPKEDVNGLANALTKIMEDEEYRQKLGANAYETAQKYDIRIIGNNFQKLVEKELKMKINGMCSEELNVVKTPASISHEIMHSSSAVVPFESYHRMIEVASEGKVGIKTIAKMFTGWLKFKFIRKRSA